MQLVACSPPATFRNTSLLATSEVKLSGKPAEPPRPKKTHLSPARLTRVLRRRYDIWLRNNPEASSDGLWKKFLDLREQYGAQELAKMEKEQFDMLFRKFLSDKAETEIMAPPLDLESLVAGVEADIFGQARDEKLQPGAENTLSRQTASEARTVPGLQHNPQVRRVIAAAAQSQLAGKTIDGQEPLSDDARTEIRRVSTELLHAGTDMNLWQVLQNEVFAKVQALDLDAKPSSPQQPSRTTADPNKTNKTSEKQVANPTNDADADADSTAQNQKQKLKKPKKAKKKKKQPAETPSTPPPKPSPALSLLLQTYAPTILAATRILTLNTEPPSPTSSPLPAAILPQVRALGPTSYALAATTPLYNELLAWTWRSTGSYAALGALLAEMEGAGLVLDTGTLEIVDEVCGYRGWALSGGGEKGDGEGEGEGEGIAAIEGLKGRAAEGEAIVAWRAKIRAGLEEMELERVRRAEAVLWMEADEMEAEMEAEAAVKMGEMMAGGKRSFG